MPVLTIKNLHLQIGDNILVNDVSIQINEGEIHGLIGESGSGKSLTAMSILGLLPKDITITRGEILLEDNGKVMDLAKLGRREMENLRGNRIGFIFQDPMTSLNPSIKCGKQVAEVLRQHSILKGRSGKDEVLNLFNRVMLTDPEKIYSSYPHEISGGQRQRVMIAMAVACKPKLLIADEPTTALDVTVQKSIIDLIDDLRKNEGLSVLFITHDLGLISSYANNLSIMYQGEIVESGSRETIIENPEHKYTRGLLACKPPIDKKIDRLLTIDEVMSDKQIEAPPDEKVTSQKNEVLLEVRDLNTFYILKRDLFGKVSSEMHALKQINFKLHRKDSMALVGESGSGKSTLGRSLLRLIESRSGSVVYEGKSILEMSTKEFKELRKKIQFIFQDPYASLNPKIIVGESILEPLKVHGIGNNFKERKEIVLSLLAKVGLNESDYDKYPHQFSGGQRQRIVIARALTVDPEFIVCDEAVSALDVSVQAKILNLLKDLQKEFNLTYLFITHDMSVVRYFCDRVLVMKEGEIVESADSEDLFSNPKHPFTKELISASF